MPRVFHHVPHETVALENVIDDAEFVRLFERECIAGDHKFDGLTLAHQPRESLGSPGSRQNPEVHLRQPDLPRIFARNADIGGHRNLQSSAHAVPINGSDHQLGRVLQTQQHFVGVQTKVILECRIDAGKHLDVRPGREEFIPSAGEEYDVRLIVHARFQDGIIHLAIHLIGIGIGGGIAHLQDRYAAIGAVVDQLFRTFRSCRLHCRRHE